VASTSSVPGRKFSGSEFAVVDRVDGGASFEIFEAIAGHDPRLRSARRAGGLGPADALQEAGRTLWRAHLHDEVDVAPVDAEVEACRRDQSAQLARRPSPPSTLRPSLRR
jgi:hypothetical protein